MEIEYQIIDSVETYRLRIPEVAQLFSTVFQRAFPADTWGQLYFNNPYGNPCVALAYSGDQLVGHHALIPQKLVGDCGVSFRYFLSVSTMVHPRHRNLSGFLHMVNALHEEARAAGLAFILVLPNGTSAPIFEKLCGYTPIFQTGLCNWRPSCHAISANEQMFDSLKTRGGAQFSYPTDNAYWNWRTKNNHASSCAVDETLRLVYKVIEPATLMLLDAWVEGELGVAERLANFARNLSLTEIRLTRYHANLFGIPDAALTSHEGYVVRLFGFPLAEKIPDIRFSLLLSDVF